MILIMPLFIVYDSFQTEYNAWQFFYAIAIEIQILFLSPLCQSIYWKSCRLLLFFLNFMKAQQMPNIKGNQPNKGVFLITELQL